MIDRRTVRTLVVVVVEDVLENVRIILFWVCPPIVSVVLILCLYDDRCNGVKYRQKCRASNGH